MAPLEKVIDPAESKGSSEPGETKVDPNGNSSGENSRSEGSSSSNSGNSSNTSHSSGSVSNQKSGAADLTIGGDHGTQEKNDTKEEDFTHDADAVGARPGEVAEGSEVRASAGNGAESLSRRSSAVPSRSLVGSGEMRRASDNSLTSVMSRAGRERFGLSNVPGARGPTGQPIRAGSTRAAAPGSRVEVRGELRVTNVSSSEEVLRLLEDNSSPFSLQLQNVELRVSPNQSVRLGQAVPALREHLMRNLQRELRRSAGPEGDAHTSNSGSHGQTTANNRTHSSSNIMLTGMVRGSVHPNLLRSRRGATGTAKSSAVSQADIRRQAEFARSVQARVQPAGSEAASSRPALTDRVGMGVVTSAAAVLTPVSAAVSEQTGQQRVTTEASSLVQQILEVQGQVKSLLAEEGLGRVEAETAALKKKKSPQDDGEHEERLTRRRRQDNMPRGGSMDDDDETDSEIVARGSATGSSSSAASRSFSISSGSGNRGPAKDSPLPKATGLPQQNDGGTPTMRGEVSAGSGTLDELHKASKVERHEVKEPAAEITSRSEDAEGRAAGGARRQTEDGGGGEMKEKPCSTQQENAKETEGQSGMREYESTGQRRIGSRETNSSHTKSELGVEAVSQDDIEKARKEEEHTKAGPGEEIRTARPEEEIRKSGKEEESKKVGRDEEIKNARAAEEIRKAGAKEEIKKGGTDISDETDNAAAGVSRDGHREQIGGTEREQGRPPLTEQKGVVEETKEREQDIRGRTQEAEVRGTKHGTTGERGSPDTSAPPAKEREAGTKEEYSKVVKKDLGDSTNSEERIGRNAETASTQAEPGGTAQHVMHEQTQASMEEKVATLSGVSGPPVGFKEKSERQRSAEQERLHAKDAGTPLGKEAPIPKPDIQRKPSKASRGSKSSVEGDAQERHESGRVERSIKHEGEAPEKEATAAAPTAAPTFVQAFTSLFSWATTEEESKPSSSSAIEGQTDEEKTSAEAEADKASATVPTARPGQVSSSSSRIAEEAGGNVEEGQIKKKPRPKLKPKAAPARMALFQREKE